MQRRRYSAWNLFAAARHGHTDWAPAWADAEPRARCAVAIIGGGGHGLAAAYYLAREHGITDVLVLEKGWLGGGNTGRNTTVVRSNYLYPESARLYGHSLAMYEGLSQALNFNIMFSQRGVLTLAHSRHDLDAQARWLHAMRFNGADAECLDAAQVRSLEPRLNFGHAGGPARHPILGGLIQRRGGTARHDAVAWGYARAASALGVGIVQGCEVLDFERSASGRLSGLRVRWRGRDSTIACERAALVVAGASAVLARRAGFALPLASHALQAMVTEPVKPVLNTVTLSPALGAYWSQSDKGEVVIGGGLDAFPSYAQRGSFAVMQTVVAATVEMLPSLAQLRLLRQWSGTVDVTPDSSPILGDTPLPGLAINCGWGTGGFKAIPVGGWTLAHHLATGRVHELAEPFGLTRFASGRLIDEAAASGIAH